MDDLGRRDQGSAGRRFKRLGLIAVVLTVGLTIGVAPVIGDGMNAAPVEVTNVPTVRATQAQVAASTMNLSGASVSAANKGKRKNRWRRGIKRVVVESRITDSASPIVTPEGKGSFVEIACPKGSLAISGGLVTNSINLLLSGSSNNSPENFAYSPRKWYISVTNVNVDGRGGALSWRGMVNCLSPAKLKGKD